MENNKLIKVQKKSLFNKISNYIKSIFGKSNIYDLNDEYVIKEDNKENILDGFEKDKDLLNIQEKFENGKLNEEDLSNEEKQELIKLYREQINDLEKNIDYYKTNLETCKNKIIKLKSKLENSNS